MYYAYISAHTHWPLTLEVTAEQESEPAHAPEPETPEVQEEEQPEPSPQTEEPKEEPQPEEQKSEGVEQVAVTAEPEERPPVSERQFLTLDRTFLPLFVCCSMSVVCCRCNASGRCKNCACKKAGRECLSCLPRRRGQCEKSTPLAPTVSRTPMACAQQRRQRKTPAMNV